MKLNFLPAFCIMAIMLMLPLFSFAQGVTTSSMNGRITDTNGDALIGANVLAVHTPTGTTYGNITNLDGYYRIPNMRVGGPYNVTISYTGFQDYKKEDVYLRLGQSFKLSTELSEASTDLGEITVTANRNDVFDGNRTGAETTITEAQIANLPTVARAIGDYARLTPQATVTEGNDGFTISLNGMNNRYNAIYIDGAVNNDVFGLAGSGTNGGQTGVSPFSVDAIEEFQVSLAPFDVRQGGFAGGAINAITRSGSNNWEGSVYTFFRNEDLAGKTPTDNDAVDRVKLDEFSSLTAGFRVGGPIIKDKLFFFVNAEIQRDEIPLPFDFANYEGDSNEADLEALENKLMGYGYDPGPYNAGETRLNSEKITVRLDYNINQNHKLNFRHSYVHADNIEGVQSGARTINYKNESEAFLTTTNTTSAELSSVIGSEFSNNLILSYTRVRDDRDPLGDPFPYVDITDGSGSIIFGSERFSTANQLDQDIFTISDAFEIYKGKHNITIGTHNEFYSVYNLFIPQNYGVYEFDSLEDFMTDQNSSFYVRGYSLQDNVTGDGSIAGVSFNGGQAGFYVQDEMQVNENLKITGGIRFDIPFFDQTPTNNEFNTTTIPLLEEYYDLRGAETGKFIKTQVLVSPRFGFNLDLTGEQKTQIRGGIGMFTSRVPLVWPGGAYNNYGLGVGTELAFGDQPFVPQWDMQPPGEIDPNNAEPSGSIDLFAEDFKIPQVMKANLAIDQKLPGGLIGNLDFIYNKTLNNVAYQNLNLRPSNIGLEGTGDNRRFYNRSDEIDDTYSRILLGYNTNKGYTYNFTASLTLPETKGFSGMLAFSYGDAYSTFDGTSSQNSSQWRGQHAVDGRNFDQQLARSDFSQGSRIISALSYKQYWNEAKNFASTISVFWESQAGRPYSYIYNDNGNLNREDSRERNLLYIPLNQDDIFLVDDSGAGTAAEQWTALDAFIESDDYLSARRGEYAERNASRAPWSHVMDLKFIQDFTVQAGGKDHTLQLSLDFFNFTNLLSPKWGRRYFVGSFNNFELLNFEGFLDDDNGDPTMIPSFTFDGVTDNNPAANRIDDSGIQSSRWQMQVGIRYIFK